MDLQILRDYFSFLARCEFTLNDSRATLEPFNSFSYYKLIAQQSQPSIDHTLLTKFVKSFTYTFQPSHGLTLGTNYTYFPQQQQISQQEILSKGIDLFLDRWSTSERRLTFEDFSMLLKEEAQLPSKAQQLAFPVKKKFFDLIEHEIQSLLDAEAFRKAIGQHYRNLSDLFEILSTDGLINIEQLQNLFLMVGERKNQVFYEMLGSRFPLPMDEATFRKWFEVPPSTNKYRQQTKIYYSSIKRKIFEFRKDDERYTTPKGKNAAQDFSSTKMTKADRLNSIKRSAVEVSRFQSEECPESKGDVLMEVLGQEERVNQMKRQLMYQPDYDLELIYERKGDEFQQILNKKYGSCNFTSFVRYIVPQDYEHRYAAFIKSNPKNQLNSQTQTMIQHILAEELRKEAKVGRWFEAVDKETLFRGYCNPGEKGISQASLGKYFTLRECHLLMDRFDPHKTGTISYQAFC